MSVEVPALREEGLAGVAKDYALGLVVTAASAAWGQTHSSNYCVA